LLLVSGNDCAEALAQAAGGRARTVALMNRTALALGAYDTLVQTPSGLDGWSQLTSAYDMMLVLRAALAQPRFIAYDRVAHTYLPAQKADGVAAVPLWNQNEQFLTSVRGALVAKTGYTDAAQHTFVGAITRGGHRYGVVLMRAQRWPDDQWVQATKLVKWAVALPRGTAPVGRLETPPAPPAPTPSPSSAAAQALLRARSASPLTRDGGGFPTAVVVVLVVALLGGATAFTARHLRPR
jgi:D-alanyl-D-alanine carboxypeptidase (penicillin-binding protein 5/6)